jgi:hypothetical protein
VEAVSSVLKHLMGAMGALLVSTTYSSVESREDGPDSGSPGTGDHGQGDHRAMRSPTRGFSLCTPGIGRSQSLRPQS